MRLFGLNSANKIEEDLEEYPHWQPYRHALLWSRPRRHLDPRGRVTRPYEFFCYHMSAWFEPTSFCFDKLGRNFVKRPSVTI
jgi:hypothetical protein